MNTLYLDSMPEVENKYEVELEDGEKVVFTSKMPSTIMSDKNEVLSMRMTLTNKRLIFTKKPWYWSVDIAEDITECKKVEGKLLFFIKHVYFLIKLNKEVEYNDGKSKLNGYKIELNTADTLTFEEIIEHLKG